MFSQKKIAHKGLSLIQAWIRRNMPIKVGDEITYLSRTSKVQPLKFGNVEVI